MGSGWAIQLGPSWVNLILNLTKYINSIDFIYIIDTKTGGMHITSQQFPLIHYSSL